MKNTLTNYLSLFAAMFGAVGFVGCATDLSQHGQDVQIPQGGLVGKGFNELREEFYRCIYPATREEYERIGRGELKVEITNNRAIQVSELGGYNSLGINKIYPITRNSMLIDKGRTLTRGDVEVAWKSIDPNSVKTFKLPSRVNVMQAGVVRELYEDDYRCQFYADGDVVRLTIKGRENALRIAETIYALSKM